MVRHEFNVNYEVMLSQLAPQEVFIEYGTEVSEQKYLWHRDVFDLY